MSQNPYILELVQRMDNRYAIDTDDMSLGDWMCRNTHLRGRPFSFDRYPFQKAIADDLHPNMDVAKPSQIGLTEVQVRKTISFLARNRGTTAIFTMPTDAMFERTSATRILPLVRDEKCFNLESSSRGAEKPIRSKGLIQIGTSFLYVTGSKEGDATSIPADMVMNDEVDLMDQQMMALFSSRMQDSDWKINQRFSTPTYADFGIDAGYQSSDQHEYLVRCGACNHWQAPVFAEQFIELPGLPSTIPLNEIDIALIDTGMLQIDNAYVCCEKCRAPLDLGREGNREWVARYASRTLHRGYRVSPFSTDRLSISYIIQQLLHYRKLDYLKGWHNTVLGQPFNDGNVSLTDAVINPCFSASTLDPTPSKEPHWLGIDMGQTCHLVMGQGESFETMKVVLFKAIPVSQVFVEVEILLKDFNIVGGACDRHPYTPTADALFEMSKGVIFPVEYRGTKDLHLLETHAQANRTPLLDRVAKAVRLGKIRFSGYGLQRSTIVEHLKDMVRDESPETPAVWIKKTGNDHYFHALGFLGIALEIQEGRRIAPDLRSSVVILPVQMPHEGFGLQKSKR